MLLQLVNANTRKLLLTYNKLNTLLAIEVNFMATILQINDKLREYILSEYKAEE